MKNTEGREVFEEDTLRPQGSFTLVYTKYVGSLGLQNFTQAEAYALFQEINSLARKDKKERPLLMQVRKSLIEFLGMKHTEERKLKLPYPKENLRRMGKGASE